VTETGKSIAEVARAGTAGKLQKARHLPDTLTIAGREAQFSTTFSTGPAHVGPVENRADGGDEAIPSSSRNAMTSIRERE
jgi:hypothetical protein